MIKFGTGGWRAIIADEFTKENIRILAQALSNKMLAEGAKEIVIGFDRRFLSDVGAKWAAEVFAGNGITPMVIDKNAPTPLIMFAVKYYNYQYGMSVTASHNPAIYNGIKIFTAGGRDADQSVTKIIEELAEQVTEIKSIEYDVALAEGKIRIIERRKILQLIGVKFRYLHFPRKSPDVKYPGTDPRARRRVFKESEKN